VTGDPLRYHSHFTAIVIPSRRTAIPPIDLVSWGRLATAVKKAHLLAAWDEETKEVEFFSLEWAGF
jgi:tRNA-splicing endonuclease subunit Sen34